jgi:hypothetical protein
MDMRLQSLVVAFLVVVAGAFLLLNQDVVMEPRSVQLPGVSLTVPILGITLLVAVAALVGMLLVRAAEGLSQRRSQRRLHERLAQREHDVALLKSAAYDRVAAMVEGIHREVSTWVAGEARRQEQLRTQLAALQRAVPAPVLPEADRGAAVPPVAAERNAA